MTTLQIILLIILILGFLQVFLALLVDSKKLNKEEDLPNDKPHNCKWDDNHTEGGFH